MQFYNGKRILVTGGTGMIGRPLVEMLIEQGASVRIASLDDPSRAHPDAEFKRVNLMRFDDCLEVAKGMDFVFQVAGIKGSPAMTSKKPASFFVPLILMNTNMMEAARQAGAERYLFTSTIGVYAPAEVFHEDDVWKTFPSNNDRFAGWAKRMGELQADAYRIEFGWNNIAIVRPANVYGPFDNFDPKNAMVIPSLIRRAVDGENPLSVWGDGSPVRDFIHCDDVARGMLLAMEKMPAKPMNLGSGEGVSIRRIVEIIRDNLDPAPEIKWDTSKPSGDPRRLMDMSYAASVGFKPTVTLEEGIAGVIAWFRENRDQVEKRYNVFTADKYV
ncbi:MAG: NAD-dependent epimerase/dehydratase family protein [Lentisphaerales bacterium]|nr:MAG: NAD-dependent epimerase/dehydratase family protein [Lentisphaerales bacterium]